MRIHHSRVMSTDDVSSQNFSERNSGCFDRTSRIVYDSDNYIRRNQNNNNTSNHNNNNNNYNPQGSLIPNAIQSSSVATSAGVSARGGREQRDSLLCNRNGPFSPANVLSERSANNNNSSPNQQHNNRVPPSSAASWYDIATANTNGPGGSGNVGASVAGDSINSHHNQHHHYYTNTPNVTTAHSSSFSSTTFISQITPPASSTITTTSSISSAIAPATTTTLTSSGSAIYQRENSHDSGLSKRSKLNRLFKASSAGSQSGVESPSSTTVTALESPVSSTTTTATVTSLSNSSCSTISSSNNTNLSSSSNSTTFCSSGIGSNSILNAMTSASVAVVSSASNNSSHCNEISSATATSASSSTNPTAIATNNNNNSNNNSNSTTSHNPTRVTHARCTTSSSRSHSRSPSSYSSSHSSSSSSQASSHSHASSPVLGAETPTSSARNAPLRSHTQSAVATSAQGSSSNNPSVGGACSSSSSSSSSGSSCATVANPVVHSEDNRPLAIRVRNLPARSSDTSLKDGLFHEYKKHGKVTWVKVVGQNSERYALVCFKKPEDVEKALEVSHDKLFFGCKIEVEPYQGYDVEDNEFRPYEAELDEYHPKSTRTLFIGNLEKDITASELRSYFESFGEIIEIDIKKQGMNAYAFCQYSDIVSVVKAMRKMDGEHLGNNRIKLGFGKSMPTNCVWIDGIGEKILESHLQSQFSRYGTVTRVHIDRVRQLALVLYEQIQYAQTAVKEMRGATLRGRRLQVDFASRECQDAFCEKLEKQNAAGRLSRYDSQSRSRASSFSRHQNSNDGCSPSNTPGSSSGSSASGAQPPVLSSAVVSGSGGISGSNSTASSTGNSNVTSVVGQVGTLSGGGSSTPARSRAMRSMRSHTIDYDYADVRRFRAYDEYSQGSAASHDEDVIGGTPLTPLHSAYTSGVASSGLRSDSPLLSRLGPIVGSAAAANSANETFEVTLNSSRRRCDKSPGKQKGDIRVLQKERFHLLEQLEECPSSGDENIASPRKRIKTDHHHSSNIPSGLDANSIGEIHRSNLISNCDSNLHDTLLHRKGDIRRLSDFGKYHLQPPHQQQQHHHQHHSRRPSNDLSATIGSVAADHTSVRHNSTSSSSSEHYGQHQHHGTPSHMTSAVPCKRRRVISGGNCNSSLSSTLIGGVSNSIVGGPHTTSNDEYHHHPSRGRSHLLHSHHSHEASCGESADGSRPGTPLCDERPEVLPTEPRRVPRERPNEPLVLPLPKFGIHFFQQYRNSSGASAANASSGYHHHSGNTVSSLANAHFGLPSSHLSGNSGCSGHSSLNHNQTPSSSASSAHLPSPSSRYPHWRPHHHHHHHHNQASSTIGSGSSTSASAAVVSPLRPRSLSSNSSDSDVQAQSSGSPSLEERIRTLDEMYERWSGGSAIGSAAIKRHDFGHNNASPWREHSSTSLNMPSGSGVSALTTASTPRHKFLDLDVNELQPSDIVKSVLAKKSLFDDDLQRLTKNQWLEPSSADVTVNVNTVSSGLPNLGAATKSPVVGSTNSTSSLGRSGALLQRLSSLSPMNSPQASMSPYNSPSPSPSVSCSFVTSTSVAKQISTTTSATPALPVSTTSTATTSSTKGLQYPFPTHPPLPSTAEPGPVAQPPLPAELSKPPPMPAEQPPPPPTMDDTHADTVKPKQNIKKSLSVPTNCGNQIENPATSTSPLTEGGRVLNKSVSVPGSTNTGTVKVLSSTTKSSPEVTTVTGNSSSTTALTNNKSENDNSKSSKFVAVTATSISPTSAVAPSKKNEKSHKHTHRNDSEKKTKHDRSSEKRKKSIPSTPRVEEESSDSDGGAKSHEKSTSSTVAEKEKTDREYIEKEKQHHQRERERQESEKREREVFRQQEKEERERKEKVEREKRENEHRERLELEEREREESEHKKQMLEHEHLDLERHNKTEKLRSDPEERERRIRDDLEKQTEKSSMEQNTEGVTNVQHHMMAVETEKQNNKDNTVSTETSSEHGLSNKHYNSVRKSSHSSPIRHPKRRLSSQDNSAIFNSTQPICGDENAKRLRIEAHDQSAQSTKEKESHTKDPIHRSTIKHHHHQRQHSSSSHKSDHGVQATAALTVSSSSGNLEKSKSKEHSSKSKSKHHNKTSSSHGQYSTAPQNLNPDQNTPLIDRNALNESTTFGSPAVCKTKPGLDSVSTPKVNHRNEDISSDQEHESAPSQSCKPHSTDDEELQRDRQQENQQGIPKTPSHGHHSQHRHREHHSSSRHKSKREHREKKRHSIAESSTGGNTMTDEEFVTNAALSINRRVSAGGSTTSEAATPTTRDIKPKSLDHLSGERKLSRCSEDSSNMLPNTPTCRAGVSKATPSRKMIMSSADSDDSEDTAAAKKRSIFDIPDDGPYVSMYDKVKARSCKNMQKQEEEKKIKAKFSQLKQSRAKREGKKRSASYDGDSDSDFDEQHSHRGSYKSRNHGGLSSSSDGGAVEDDDDEESIIARRRSSQASSSHRKFSDSDSTAAEVAEDAARRMRTHENLLRLCDGDDSSEDDIRNSGRRTSPGKRFSASKRSSHALQRIASDSESQSQPLIKMDDVKVKQEIKQQQDESTAQSIECENKVKNLIKEESCVGSDMELKLKRRSPISSADDQQIIPPMNVKMEPGMLSVDEIKKEDYKNFFGDNYEFGLSEHKVKEMIQQQVHFSLDGVRKKHKKSKKRQKGSNVIVGLEISGISSSHQTPSNTLNMGSKMTTDLPCNNNVIGEIKTFDVFDELKRQEPTKLEPSTPPTASKNGSANEFLVVNSTEKKRHKDRKEKKREKIRSLGGCGDISTDLCSLMNSNVEVEKLSKEERHRLKKSKKSKSLELIRSSHSSHTPATPGAIKTTPYDTQSAIKRIEGKMEDIFGPISDEESQSSDVACKDLTLSTGKLDEPCAGTPTSSNNFTGSLMSTAMNPYKQEPLTPKSHTVEENEENILKVSSSIASSSPSGVNNIGINISERERLRREKREKKRRERERSREQHALSVLQQQIKHDLVDDENSVDLDEAGRALEAQLMEDSDIKITEDATPSTATTYRSDMTDFFRFSDGDENSVEFSQSSSTNKKDCSILSGTLVPNVHNQQQPIGKSKEKKKKKKRSKEERHHHQRRESSCSSSSSHHMQYVQPATPKTSMMSPPPPSVGHSAGKLTIDVNAASKHAQKLEKKLIAPDEDDNSPALPICKPSPSLPCLIGDDDDDINLCRPKNICKTTVSPNVSTTGESLPLSPIREKQMISPIPKTPTTASTPKQKNNVTVKTPGKPDSLEKTQAITSTPTSSTVPASNDNSTPLSSSAVALSPVSSGSNQKKKPEKFIPGFDGELDEKISESAVQSISAELNTPVLDPSADEPKIPVESPPDGSKHLEKIEESKSRVQISQEETESAVSALLGESFGNSSTADFDAYNDVGCLDDLAASTVAGADEEAAIAARAIEGTLKEPVLQTEEDRDEVSMAVQSLSAVVDISEIKAPDTPQSDRGLQIDTDTEDTNADEADSSGNSLKIDETATASPSQEKSDKFEGAKLLAQSVHSGGIVDVTAASVITKVERLEPIITDKSKTITEKNIIEDKTGAKVDLKKENEATSNVESAKLPSMISLEEPAAISSSMTSTINTSTSTKLMSSTVNKTLPASNSSSPSVDKGNQLPTQSSDVSFMKPTTISIPDVHFVLPQMTSSPRSGVGCTDRNNVMLSPRSQHSMTSQSPRATALSGGTIQTNFTSGPSSIANQPCPTNSVPVSHSSTQHSPSNTSVGSPMSPSSQNRILQQGKSSTTVKSNDGNTFSYTSSAQQSGLCKSNNNSITHSGTFHATITQPQSSTHMRSVQSGQLTKSVIEHGSGQQQQQYGSMSISLQKVTPVTAHSTIISKVVSVQPQQAQKMPSPTRLLHSPIHNQQQLGHGLNTVPKTITNPYNQQQQQQLQQQHPQQQQQQHKQQDQQLPQEQQQQHHHLVHPRAIHMQKGQHIPEKLQQQQSQPTKSSYSTVSSSPTQSQSNMPQLGLTNSNNIPSPTSGVSGNKPIVVLANQMQQNTVFYRQQQSQQQNQQSITSNMQHSQQQQSNSPVSQGIIVQQQIIGRASQSPEQTQQQPQHTQTKSNTTPNTLVAHGTNNTYAPKQVSPSIVIEPLGVLSPTSAKDIGKTSATSMSVSTVLATKPTDGGEKTCVPTNKSVENVSVIRNPPTPTNTANNHTNSTTTPTSYEALRAPVFEVNSVASVPLHVAPKDVATSKEDNIDQKWSQSAVQENITTDSVIKKADKVEDKNSAQNFNTSPSVTAATTINNTTSTPTTVAANTLGTEGGGSKEVSSMEAATASSTDHDTEDETETKQLIKSPAMFEQIPTTQANVSKAIRGGGAKRGRQPRGGKKQTAGVPVQMPATELDSGIQTRLRKPVVMPTVTRGRKGRPPRNALLAQRTLQQQQQLQQQEFNLQHEQKQQMQQTTNNVPGTQSQVKPSSVPTAAEKKERSQSFSSAAAGPLGSTTNTSSDQDVYEFHDECTEEIRNETSEFAGEDARPRLILTIKSPGHATPVSKAAEKSVQLAIDPLAMPASSPGQAQVDILSGSAQTQKEFSDLQSQRMKQLASGNAPQTPQGQQKTQQEEQLNLTATAIATAGNTRKSRRLQEKDRSTIDDIIEDVVRNTQTPPPNTSSLPKGAQTPPRRSGRNVVTNTKKNETSTLALPHTPNAVGRPRRSKDRKLGTENPVDNSNASTVEQQAPKTIHQSNPVVKSKNTMATENSPNMLSVEDHSPAPRQANSVENNPAEGLKNQTQTHSVPSNIPNHSITHHPQHPKKKAIAAAEIESYAAAAAAAAMSSNPTPVSSIPSGGLPIIHTAAPSTQKVTGGTADVVNKSLIDPVTGVISGMQQGKEGNLPMATAAVKKMLPTDNIPQHQSHQVTDSTRSSPPVIHKLPSSTTATAIHPPTHNQLLSGAPTSIATPITALCKPVQTEAAAPAATLTVPASLANKPVSVVVKTSTAPPVVIQQQIVQPNQQGTPTKQPIVLQQSQLLMHAQHTNVRPPTLKAHVLNSQKQLQQQSQQATLTPIPPTNQSQYQQQNSAIVIGNVNTPVTGCSNVTGSASTAHHVIQSNIVGRHNIQIPTTSTSTVVQHQQLLVNIPTAHSPHGVTAGPQGLLNSPRIPPQQTLVIKQSGGASMQSQQSSNPPASQVLHVISSKASAVPGLQHPNIYTVTQQQHAYMTNSTTGIKQQQQQQHQQQITVLPIEQAQHHVKQQQQQTLQHVTLQPKQIPPPTMGVSIVAHQQQQQQPQSAKQHQQPTQTLIMPPGLPPLGMPTHSNMVLQAKGLSTGMPAHLHAQQLTPSPPATGIGKQNPVVHNLQTQSTTPILSGSPPAALKIQQQLPQQSQTTMLAGTPSNIRAAIPSISPQGQARITPLLLPTGMPVTTFEPNMHDIGKYGGVCNSPRLTQSPPPAHQQASPITPGESAFSAGALRGVPTPREPFMIFQQLLRSQETINAPLRCPSDYEEKMLGSSPPLELRRPGSVPRTITVPHSLQSPQDRTSDSPQAAQIYVHNTRIAHPHYAQDVSANRSFYDAAGRQITIEPPPAHRSATGSSPFMSTPPAVHPPPPPSTPTAASAATAHMHPGTLMEREREREREREQLQREQQERLKMTGGIAGHDNLVISAAMSTPPGRNMQVATPPHGSQVPPPQPNADSLLTLLQRYPVMWQGLLALKTDQAAVQMHFVYGNPHVARASLPCNSDGSTPPLRIAQRMRLEQTQLEGVAKKMQYENEHCMLLALPCGRDHADVLQHSRNLQSGFITYLQQKMAAGIVNIPVPGSEQAAYVVHIFPSCDFANENLERAAPDLKNRVAEIAHLLIVIATV